MIYRNSIKCKKCDDEIISRHGHDYKTCSCGACSVGGGQDYLKRSGDYWETSITHLDSFEEIREVFEWVTYGKDGKSEMKFIKLKDMETNHIIAILETQLFVKELRFRRRNK